MSFFSIGRAIGVRLMFTLHGVIAIWRLTIATNESRFWYLGLVLCLLLIEMTITLGKTGGKEWKWFCPSVFIYLMCIVPTMWFMELHELDKRLKNEAAAKAAKLSSSTSGRKTHNNTLLDIYDIGNTTNGLAFSDDNYTLSDVITTASSLAMVQDTEMVTDSVKKEDLTANIGTIGRVSFVVNIPISLTPDQWIRTLEQILLLILILGRWFLPKGKLTHDQLSQLLLVYIGTAADIVEFFEAFKEKEVRNNRMLCIVIMGIWSLSLIQFSLVLTATRARRDRTGLVPLHKQPPEDDSCCSPDTYGIIVPIVLQDFPFLFLRMMLIIKYSVLSYTNMFFTCKNTIVIVLLIYRLIVVHIERRRKNQDNDTGYMLPKFDSSPSISTQNTDNKRRRRHKNPDTLSLSTTCNTLSTCSTPGSRGRLLKPFNSCNNIYEVRPQSLSSSRHLSPLRKVTTSASSDRNLDRRFAGGGGSPCSLHPPNSARSSVYSHSPV